MTILNTCAGECAHLHRASSLEYSLLDIPKSNEVALIVCLNKRLLLRASLALLLHKFVAL